MDKREFIEKYHFENATPFSPERFLIATDSFVEVLDDFLRKNFSELIELKSDIRNTKKISVSPEYTAFFFKLLLFYVRARAFVRVEALDLADEFGINITIDRPVELEMREECDIIKTARNAGYEFIPLEKGFSLRVKYTEEFRMRVYAKSLTVAQFFHSLNEIFFVGYSKCAKLQRGTGKRKQKRSAF